MVERTRPSGAARVAGWSGVVPQSPAVSQAEKTAILRPHGVPPGEVLGALLTIRLPLLGSCVVEDTASGLGGAICRPSGSAGGGTLVVLGAWRAPTVTGTADRVWLKGERRRGRALCAPTPQRRYEGRRLVP